MPTLLVGRRDDLDDRIASRAQIVKLHVPFLHEQHRFETWPDSPVLLGVTPEQAPFENPWLILCETPDDAAIAYRDLVVLRHHSSAWYTPDRDVPRGLLLPQPPTDEIIDAALQAVQWYTNNYARSVDPVLQPGTFYMIGATWARGKHTLVATPNCRSSLLLIHPPNHFGYAATAYMGEGDAALPNERLTATLHSYIFNNTKKAWPQSPLSGGV
jgi:hypothetical protein